MARKRHTAEQIIHKLREAEVALGQGTNVNTVCKQLEVTEQTYYRWRKDDETSETWDSFLTFPRKSGHPICAEAQGCLHAEEKTTQVHRRAEG
jgi:hypothetical protein